MAVLEENSDEMESLLLTFQCGLYRDKQQIFPITLQNLKQQALIFLARKYPDHNYINLQSCLAYSILSPDGIGPDQPLSCIEDVKGDSVVNICLTSRVRTSSNVNPHTLSVKSYRSPAFCDFCGQMLFGLVRQGLRCEGCGYNFHKRCAFRIPNDCPGERRRKHQRRTRKDRDSMTLVAGLSTSTLPTPSTFNADVLTSAARRRSMPHQANSLDHSSLPSMSQAVSPSHSAAGTGSLASRTKRSNSMVYVGRPVWMDRAIAAFSEDSNVKVPHTFVLHNYKRPTMCMYCKKLLRGLFRQGLQCKDCRYNVHRGCAKDVLKDCLGQILDEVKSRDSSLAIGLDMNRSLNAESPTDSGEQFVPGLDGHISDGDDKLKDDMDGDSIRSVVVRRDSNTSNPIPLQRIYVSVPRSEGGCLETIKEGWMVSFSTISRVRALYYWKLDTRYLYIKHSPKDLENSREISLSSMLAISVPTKAEPISPNMTAHCFEIKMGREGVLYIGEQTSLEKSSVHSNKDYVFPEGCGLTMEEALGQAVGERRCKPWEEAIRGAFMPVTPKPSVKTVVSVTESTNLDDSTGNVEPSPPGVPAPMFRQYNSSTVDISVMYQIFSDECLGSGQFGVVYGGVHRTSGRPVAVKVIDKLRFPSKQETALKNEVAILHTLSHPGVVNLERMFETPDRVFVVMEKMEGDMLEMILRDPTGRLPERNTRFITYQILNALQHLHLKHIVHCDLKPENVLLRGGTPNYPQIKLCDFGFARIIGEKSFRKSVVGTPAYLAPEVLNNEGYDRSLDMWSVGVIIYVSLSGTFPFNEDEEIADQIHNAEFMYPPDPWKTITRDATSLINTLLQVNKSRRCTAGQALMHPFLTGTETWRDLRTLEQEVGQRYLTHPAEERFHQDNSLHPPSAGNSMVATVATAPPPTIVMNGGMPQAAGRIATGVAATDEISAAQSDRRSGIQLTEVADVEPNSPMMVTPPTGPLSYGLPTPEASGSIMDGCSGSAHSSKRTTPVTSTSAIQTPVTPNGCASSEGEKLPLPSLLSPTEEHEVKYRSGSLPIEEELDTPEPVTPVQPVLLTNGIGNGYGSVYPQTERMSRDVPLCNGTSEYSRNSSTCSSMTSGSADDDGDHKTYRNTLV